jgi:ribosomal protein S8
MIVTLSDMFTRIKNGQRSKRSEIELHPFTSKGTVKVLDLLYKEGYIRGYKYKFITKSQNSVIVVLLKYDLIGSAVIKKIQLVSHSNKRVYSSVKNL